MLLPPMLLSFVVHRLSLWALFVFVALSVPSAAQPDTLSGNHAVHQQSVLGQSVSERAVEHHSSTATLAQALLYAEQALRVTNDKTSQKTSQKINDRMDSTRQVLVQLQAVLKAIKQQEAETQRRTDEAASERERQSAEQQNSQTAQIAALTKGKAEQQTIIAAVLSSLVVVLGLMVFMMLQYRAKRRAALEIRRQQELLAAQAQELELVGTQLSQLNEQLHTKNEELAKLNSEKNDLMEIAAHDLKAPLAGIKGLARVLDDHDDMLSAEQRKTYLKNILVSSEQMFDLINNFLNVNAIEQGAFLFNPQCVAVDEMMGAFVQHYTVKAAEKAIRMDYTCEREGLMLFANRNAVLQVLNNLLSNALKYSPYGRTVMVRVSTSGMLIINSSEHRGLVMLDTRTSSIRIEIQDEGPGISAAEQVKLFQKFTRLSARPTGGESSTGLGLSIVKRLVEAMNGQVWCESQLGHGATFIVELPSVPLPTPIVLPPTPSRQ
jgi:signal transduction histidine kinase